MCTVHCERNGKRNKIILPYDDHFILIRYQAKFKKKTKMVNNMYATAGTAGAALVAFVNIALDSQSVIVCNFLNIFCESLF